MKRLYCTLKGGLGNQLFQISKGLSLSHFFDAELVIDTGWYNGRRLKSETSRDFLLSYFSFRYRLPLRYEQKMLAIVDSCQRFQNKLGVNLLPVHSDDMRLSNDDLIKSRLVFLHGYWQTYASVQPLKAQLKESLNLKNVISNKYYQLIMKMIKDSKNSVMLHVRRGDYLTKKCSNKPLPVSYYEKALKLISSQIADPHIFLFSDDLDWAETYLPLDYYKVTVVRWTKNDISCNSTIAEFDLMKNCKHAIIANSTFSWWPAFILKESSSIVIAPIRWFSCERYPSIYDPEWILL